MIYPRQLLLGYMVLMLFLIYFCWKYMLRDGPYDRIPWSLIRAQQVNNARKHYFNKVDNTSAEITSPVSISTNETKSPSNSIVLNPHNFKYILDPPELCKGQKVFVVVFIHTAPSHFEKRMVIRQTWGNHSNYRYHNIRLVFVMGMVQQDTQMQDTLRSEHQKYQDIVQQNFNDSYRNLTYKALAGLKWIKTYCNDAKFIVKTDDDMFVNMYRLLIHLKKINIGTEVNTKSLIYCRVWYNAKVMHAGTWKLGLELYSREKYPTYCSGSAYIMTMRAAMRLLNVSYYVPFYWVDDVYITGILPLKAGGIVHKQMKYAYLFDERQLEEVFTGNSWWSYYFSHVQDLSLICKVWEKVSQLARANATVLKSKAAGGAGL